MDNTIISIKPKKHDWLFWPVIKLIPENITPNHLSMLRIFLALPIILLMYLQLYKTTGAFFIFAALLDGLDGSMARIRNQETKFGAIIDPTADKFLNAMVFLGFLFYIKTNDYYGMILAIILIDLLLFGVALGKFFIKDIMPWLDQKHLLSNDMGLPEIIHEVEVSRTGANKWGKIKMVLQVIVISALLLFDPQTSIWIHGKYAFLPDKLTLLHLSFPLLIVCIILGVLRLYGHFQAIQFKKE